MARNGYSDETKAAVMAALLTGQATSEVAKQYNIPEGTVKSWKHRGVGVASSATEKKERIGELLIAYLEANLETLRVQLGVFSDKKWLTQQSASEAAVLHGVLADKAIRLLEALADDTTGDAN